MNESANDFWERVQDLLAERNMKQTSLAEKINIAYPSMKQQIFHGRFPAVCDVLKISKILESPVDYLVLGEGPKSFAKDGRFFVPILDQKLSAGPGQPLPDEQEVKGFMEVPKYLSHYGDKLAVLYVDGDSMEPTLRRGDLVLCDSCGYDGEGLYAVQYDGDGFVKRVFKQGGKYIIKSDNPLYPQMEEPIGSDAIAIVGRVHAVIKRYD